MSLNKAQLKTDLSNLFDDTLTATGSAEDNRTAFVNRLADIIDGYVKEIQVEYIGGLAAPGGPVTGVINHTIQ